MATTTVYMVKFTPGGKIQLEDT